MTIKLTPTGRPKAPGLEPHKPSEPLPPKKIIDQRWDLLKGEDKVSLAELVDRVPQEVKLKDVWLDTGGGFFSEFDEPTVVYYDGEGINPAFEIQTKEHKKGMKEYEKSLRAWKKEHTAWQKQKEAYDKWNDKNKARRLKKEIKDKQNQLKSYESSLPEILQRGKAKK